MHVFQTTRQIPVPPASVFAAFDAERLARWWGPAGFTNTFEVCEFRPGGRWVFTMHGPDGKAYPNESRFAEIVDNERVVIRHVCAPFFTLTIGLQANAGGTLVSWHQAFDDAAVAAAVRHIVEPANEQNLDRLAHEVAVGTGIGV